MKRRLTRLAWPMAMLLAMLACVAAALGLARAPWALCRACYELAEAAWVFAAYFGVWLAALCFLCSLDDG